MAINWHGFYDGFYYFWDYDWCLGHACSAVDGIWRLYFTFQHLEGQHHGDLASSDRHVWYRDADNA